MNAIKNSGPAVARGLMTLLCLFLVLVWSSATAQKTQDERPCPVSQAKSLQLSSGSVQSHDIDPAESETLPATKPQLPYINYQGISDPDLAKKAWIEDHPEEYKAMVTGNKAARIPESEETPLNTKKSN